MEQSHYSPVKPLTPYQFTLWLLRKRRRFRVRGRSMLPTLAEGQEILVRPILSSRHQFEAGTIVLIQHPIQSGVQMIKRITSIDDEDAITVLGDNADEIQTAYSVVSGGTSSVWWFVPFLSAETKR